MSSHVRSLTESLRLTTLSPLASRAIPVPILSPFKEILVTGPAPPKSADRALEFGQPSHVVHCCGYYLVATRGDHLGEKR
jgi:hypothetical protein